MSDLDTKEKSLEETPTWAVGVVYFAIIVISILLELLLHAVAKWLKKLRKPALAEALEKIKSELMLMGFISLLLTVGQGPISSFCVSRSLASSWHPCSNAEKHGSTNTTTTEANRKLLETMINSASFSTRRILQKKGEDKCAEKGKVAFVSAYGIHQLHYFIFVLAVFHVFYCIITYILGQTKMRKWKVWEDETKTVEYQYQNDPERFRFARDTSFGRRHLNMWSKSPVLLWIVCFFRQFMGSVTKVDYLTLRHGFITAHLAPGSETRFDFQKYITRSLEDDFKVVVGISPALWFTAVLYLLSNTHGWFAYLWLPFFPLIIILVIGAKLQVIITQLGLRIQDRGDVVKGTPVVQPGDDLFWFGRPRLILFLIHLVLFQNAFQLAFFLWSWWKFGIRSCFHDHTEDIVIRISMGVIIQVVCSYVTMPLYALVTQMGSSMRPTIFNDRVARALKNWHHTARRHTRQGRSGTGTPLSSRPATPTHGTSPTRTMSPSRGMSPNHTMSPVHLLHNYRSSTAPDSLQNSPRDPNVDDEQWDPEALTNTTRYQQGNRSDRIVPEAVENTIHNQQLRNDRIDHETIRLPPGPGSIRTQHEINIGLADFTFNRNG